MWSPSWPVVLWCFLVLRYYVGHDSRAYGKVRGSLRGAMCAPLHMVLVLLCSAYWGFSGGLHFSRLPTPIPPFLFNI